ncbi:unnamed protein product [Closterium sp. NIES-64]|nr:unnamed protein product [Closterium sp. NIES-64]
MDNNGDNMDVDGILQRLREKYSPGAAQPSQSPPEPARSAGVAEPDGRFGSPVHLTEKPKRQVKWKDLEEGQSEASTWDNFDTSSALSGRSTFTLLGGTEGFGDTGGGDGRRASLPGRVSGAASEAAAANAAGKLGSGAGAESGVEQQQLISALLDLQSLLQASQEEASTLREENAELRRSLKSAWDDVARVEESKGQVHMQLSHAQEQLEQAERQLKQVQAQEQAQAEAQAQERLSQSNGQILQLQTELRAAQEEVRAARSELAVVRAELAGAQEEGRELAEGLKEASEEARELRADLEILKESLIDEQTRVGEYMEENEKLGEQVRKSLTAAAKARAEADEVREENERLLEEVGQLKDENEQAQRVLAAAQGELGQVLEDGQGQRERLKALLAESGRLREENSKLRKELDVIRSSESDRVAKSTGNQDRRGWEGGGERVLGGSEGGWRESGGEEGGGGEEGWQGRGNETVLLRQLDGSLNAAREEIVRLKAENERLQRSFDAARTRDGAEGGVGGRVEGVSDTLQSALEELERVSGEKNEADERAGRLQVDLAVAEEQISRLQSQVDQEAQVKSQVETAVREAEERQRAAEERVAELMVQLEGVEGGGGAAQRCFAAGSAAAASAAISTSAGAGSDGVGGTAGDAGEGSSGGRGIGRGSAEPMTWRQKFAYIPEEDRTNWLLDGLDRMHRENQRLKILIRHLQSTLVKQDEEVSQLRPRTDELLRAEAAGVAGRGRASEAVFGAEAAAAAVEEVRNKLFAAEAEQARLASEAEALRQDLWTALDQCGQLERTVAWLEEDLVQVQQELSAAQGEARAAKFDAERAEERAEDTAAALHELQREMNRQLHQSKETTQQLSTRVVVAARESRIRAEEARAFREAKSSTVAELSRAVEGLREEVRVARGRERVREREAARSREAAAEARRQLEVEQERREGRNGGVAEMPDVLLWPIDLFVPSQFFVF